MLIRSAGPEDMAVIRQICDRELDLEPDGAELPGILTRRAGHLALVAEAGGRVAGVCFGSLGGDGLNGHVDLVAVSRPAQGGGIGRRLLSGMEELLRERGAAVMHLSGNPPVYVWPGVDARYTVMTCLARRAGYERYRDSIDMTVDLSGADLDLGAAEGRLAAEGISCRRAAPEEAGSIIAWLRQGPWASAWPDEVASALARRPVGCHVASRGSRYVGFACHGANRRGWFGPMGTDESERQRGIGTVLLKRCLADMKSAGLATARIGWAGPVRFYARVLNARVERVYWFYRKTLLRLAGQANGHPQGRGQPGSSGSLTAEARSRVRRPESGVVGRDEW